MTTVSISELKVSLSRYVCEFRRGGDFQVIYRETSVARLVPVVEDNRYGVRERQGLLKPGRGNTTTILDEPLLVLPTSISEALAASGGDSL